MKFYQEYTKKPDLFLVNYTTLSSDNPFRFRKNLFNLDLGRSEYKNQY